jgi:hypothetical protein
MQEERPDWIFLTDDFIFLLLWIAYAFYNHSQVAAELLFCLYSFEESFEVSGSETLMVSSLNYLHKKRWSILQIFCKDL